MEQDTDKKNVQIPSPRRVTLERGFAHHARMDNNLRQTNRAAKDVPRRVSAPPHILPHPGYSSSVTMPK